jgi:hypothetical protein
MALASLKRVVRHEHGGGWIFGIAIALCSLGLMAYGRSEQRAYWAARGVIVHRDQSAVQPVERSLFGHLSR